MFRKNRKYVECINADCVEVIERHPNILIRKELLDDLVKINNIDEFVEAVLYRTSLPVLVEAYGIRTMNPRVINKLLPWRVVMGMDEFGFYRIVPQ